MTPASTMTEMLSISILAVAAGLAEHDEGFEPSPRAPSCAEPEGAAASGSFAAIHE